MEKNIGEIDRKIRLFVGIVLILIGIAVLKEIWSYVTIIFGLVLIITALTKFCGLYTILGIKTCE